MPPRRTFGTTWWGHAWVESLEQRARVDPNRLPRGRTYARKGTVSELAIGPGVVAALVRGSRPQPYRVTIRMREFTPPQWERLLDVVGRRLGHAAALLDGELPEELAAQARGAGADLLPGPGDLRPRCSCPDSANPCKHVAAVYYLVADAVDADPFVLFELRGRARSEVLALLRSLRTPERPKRTRVHDPGLTPKRAYARRVTAVPALPPVPAVAGPPAVLDLDPPPNTGWTTAGFAALAADAAALARDLLVSGGAAADLTFEEDLARRAAARPAAELPALATAAGMPLAELTSWAKAWSAAGRCGLSALRDVWSAGPGPLAAARSCLADAGLPTPITTWRNRVTQGPLQLRYGLDHRWYRFLRTGTSWHLDGPPSTQPLDVAYPPG
ncbi:MAG TPA: SWIM zinc finger family protein [Amycolatopsis sp.]|nr:SWIM zinc finger family protein [Amycolatopsis sp.]